MRETGYIQLLKSFSEIPDPRADLGKRHRLDDILFIALVGLLAGANDAEGMVRFAKANLVWFKGLLTLDHGIPSHDTLLRVLAVVCTALIEDVLRSWVASLRELCGEPTAGWHLPIDGKTERGSCDRASGKKAIHSVSVFLSELGACRKLIGCEMSIRLYTMNLLRSDRLLANQLFSTVRELPGVNPCSFGQLPPSSQTALGASRNTPTRS